MSIQLGVNSNYFSNKLNQNTSPGKVLARVDKVILGPTEANGQPDVDFKANGRWASIGAIRFTVLYGGEAVDNVTNTIARPYSPNITQYPLKGEIVELTYGPSTRLNESPAEKDLYYQSPVNLWNSVHHNAFPNFISLTNFNSNLTVPYQDATRGVTATTVTSSQVYPLGNTFIEKSTVKNLQPFEGDIIYQSRWGQSIRFGSTVLNSAIKNPWSSTGKSGDPITIIRNGQALDKSVDPWVTNIEDINNDAASIYLCSGQAIVIQDLSNFKLDSFTIDSKLTENTTQPLKKQPTSTDATSPASQSQFELQYAQTSTQVTVPSTIPQTNVTVTYAVTGSPSQSSTNIINITSTTVLPTGQISSSVITAPYDPFGIGKLGPTTTNALVNPPIAPTIATTPTGNRPITTTGEQTETGKDLEVIVAEESDLRFNFEIDPSIETEAVREAELLNDPKQKELQKQITEEGTGGDGSWNSLNKTIQAIYGEAGQWKESGKNSKILNTYREVGAPQNSDDVPWCAAFVGYVLKTSGLTYLKGNLSSVAYAKYGKEVPIDKPSEWRQWDIVVWSHTSKPGTGHVAFLNGVTGNGQSLSEQISALGGNQGNGVKISRYPYKGSDMKLIAIRRGPWTPPGTQLAKATGEIGGSTV